MAPPQLLSSMPSSPVNHPHSRRRNFHLPNLLCLIPPPQPPNPGPPIPFAADRFLIPGWLLCTDTFGI